MRHDPTFAGYCEEARQNMARHLREQLEAEAREALAPTVPALFRADFTNAYVAIAGWKTPACAPTRALRRF